MVCNLIHQILIRLAQIQIKITATKFIIPVTLCEIETKDEICHL